MTQPRGKPVRKVGFFFFFYFFFCVPSYISLGFAIFGEIFAYVTVGFFCLFGVVCLFVFLLLSVCLFVCCCFYPTIDVALFRLRGWCMLGVFWLPAFTSLGMNVRIF